MQFNDILTAGKSVKKVVAVCQAADTDVIKAVCRALKETEATFRLYGDERKIKALLEQEQQQQTARLEIRHTLSEQQSVERSVRSVARGEAHVLMKGLVATPVILKEVLKKEHQLTTGRKLSHLAFFNVPLYHKMLMVTDAGMNISPTLDEKVDIINNALITAKQLGYSEPKVALISAIELINPKMPSTVDAALIAQMSQRKQIKGGIIDGPFALDNAISKDAALHKGMDSVVAGDADILVMPQIESGNVLYKSLTYLAGADVASMVVGAKVPVILSSRADKFSDKYNSIVLALSTL
ncbi:bifunctional enoyl-CoA hydratase/phosphate acetyltransferase [Macrococcus equipercicus]|uniref:Bifunctional enoyl-CoA hydratase/phosphate acetyltransferase n=1 Tax=Macrococcus equipercicus TaxID=69967 RepID=A0A9Q9BLV1_9STAP|nr:bifunctional enoyl-CoA hydratase/phosphate acetyltransferase [Macrococcus equipercicus]KAA1040137.1 bifunctional enoyl-CoA hydratase/phosphate acetyltransferase [Macrococcus equipercicus]UTH12915.1 bifunctional enoyl-CoA hydratase/phosphate acetyltransferase [Macrococcus equipercicus]